MRLERNLPVGLQRGSRYLPMIQGVFRAEVVTAQGLYEHGATGNNKTLDDSTLTISGSREFTQETDEQNYHRIERRYGAFTAAIRLAPFDE